MGITAWYASSALQVSCHLKSLCARLSGTNETQKSSNPAGFSLSLPPYNASTYTAPVHTHAPLQNIVLWHVGGSMAINSVLALPAKSSQHGISCCSLRALYAV